MHFTQYDYCLRKLSASGPQSRFGHTLPPPSGIHYDFTTDTVMKVSQIECSNKGDVQSQNHKLRHSSGISGKDIIE